MRIGIHSGYPTSTADNYIGLDVNTASRIAPLGHGGQIVASDNTRESVKATYQPRSIALAHHLHGLSDSVPLVQVAAKGLATFSRYCAQPAVSGIAWSGGQLDIRRAATAWLVYEDESTVAFLDIGQATVGHTVVMGQGGMHRILVACEDPRQAV